MELAGLLYPVPRWTRLIEWQTLHAICISPQSGEVFPDEVIKFTSETVTQWSLIRSLIQKWDGIMANGGFYHQQNTMCIHSHLMWEKNIQCNHVQLWYRTNYFTLKHESLLVIWNVCNSSHILWPNFVHEFYCDHMLHHTVYCRAEEEFGKYRISSISSGCTELRELSKMYYAQLGRMLIAVHELPHLIEFQKRINERIISR